MCAVVVVKTWVLSLGGVEVAIKGMDFLADLEDQVSLQEGVEVLGVLRARLREHLLEDELVDWTTLHGGLCSSGWLAGWLVVVCVSSRG